MKRVRSAVLSRIASAARTACSTWPTTTGSRASSTAIADVLRERVRRSDMVARVGGDEFAILLPQASREQAMQVAEAIAQAIRDRVYISAGNELQTTASIGVAAVDSDDTPERVLLRADQAMYGAKEAGRDAVVLAGPPPAPPRT